MLSILKWFFLVLLLASLLLSLLVHMLKDQEDYIAVHAGHTRGVGTWLELSTKSSKSQQVSPPRPPSLLVPGLRGTLKVGDYYQPGFTKTHGDLCPNNGLDLRLLVFVNSSPDHSQPRQAIRHTWGHYALRTDIVIVFIVGYTNVSHVQDMIDQEDELYGDMVQSNSVDVYNNLTLKTTAMFEWVKTYCPQVPFVLKADDDVFINVPLLLDFMKSIKKAKLTMYGRLYVGSKPIRQKSSKYYVGPAYDKEVFPNFLAGPAYLLTGDVVAKMYDTLLQTPFIILEDVLLTGIVAEVCNITRIGDYKFTNKRMPGFIKCHPMRFISVHKVKVKDQFEMYKSTLVGLVKC